MHHLDKIFYSRMIRHPTWFRWVIDRITKKRYVSGDEILALAKRYGKKHNYSYGLLLQHGFRDESYTVGRPLEVFAERWGVCCRIDVNGAPIYTQYCLICGGGVNPVHGGKEKKRECCKNIRCVRVYNWWINNWRYKALFFSLPSNLKGIYILSVYLKCIARNKKERHVYS